MCRLVLSVFIESGSCCTQVVLNYINDEIGEQKAQLFSRLGVKTTEGELKDIKWCRLCLELERLGRNDMVKYITEHTLITEGK